MLDPKRSSDKQWEWAFSMTKKVTDPDALPVPTLQLGIGLTGHRDTHPRFAANRDAIAATLSALFEKIDARIAAHATKMEPCTVARPRMHSLLAYGADVMAVGLAQARGWDVSAPLPFGLALNVAINAQPQTLADMDAILAGQEPAEEAVANRVRDIHSAASQALLFQMAEEDAAISQLFAAKVAGAEGDDAMRAFDSAASPRAAMAARAMIEQSDMMIGVWDGVTPGAIGGTRHTIMAALDMGVPVIWVDVSRPGTWHILQVPEMMMALPQADAGDPHALLDRLIAEALIPPRPADHGPKGLSGLAALQSERWRPRSSFYFQAYRRVEALFGGKPSERLARLRQDYETPQAIVAGSAAPLIAATRALPGADTALIDRIEEAVIRPFAWADGVSTWLADAYRGSMVSSFMLSALAIVGGMAYLPFASIEQKWSFALFELLILLIIIGLAFFGRRWRWHGRWFETRRVAEYFRHAPLLLMLGVARSSGRWPKGPGGSWPEWYARHMLRGIGLPRMTVTAAYLRQTLALLKDRHVLPQRDYHVDKAERLKRAQLKLDRFSETLFILAVISVACYLLVELGAAAGLLPYNWPHDSAKAFTFLGVLFPTLGGGFAGIHYFGDFERFASISEITAEKLDAVADRVDTLLGAPDEKISYALAANLGHAIDEIVVTEIENWQSVFGGKHITVPV